MLFNVRKARWHEFNQIMTQYKKNHNCLCKCVQRHLNFEVKENPNMINLKPTLYNLNDVTQLDNTVYRLMVVFYKIILFFEPSHFCPFGMKHTIKCSQFFFIIKSTYESPVPLSRNSSYTGSCFNAIFPLSIFSLSIFS